MRRLGLVLSLLPCCGKKKKNESNNKHDDAELYKIFRKFDVDGDGKIGLDDLTRTFQKPESSSPPPLNLEKLLAKCDRDGDGFLNFDEFKKSTILYYDIDELRTGFGFYDKDGDGKISAGDLHSAFREFNMECSVEDCRKMIDSVDEDGDGAVDFEEFKNVMNFRY